MNTFIEVSTYVRIRLWNSCSCGGHEGGYVVCHRLVESHNVEEQAMAREDEKSVSRDPSYVLWLWALYDQDFLPFPRTHPDTASSLDDKQGYTERHTLDSGLR